MSQSSQALAFVYHQAVDLFELNTCTDHSNSCCSIDIDLENQEDKNGCCQGGDCDCTCCHHQLVNYVFQLQKFEITSSTNSRFYYNNSLITSVKLGIWHPPQLI